MNIGIIGVGVTGNAMFEVLKDNFNVYLYDKFKPEYSDLNSLIKNSEAIFICVPTPMKDTGEINLEAVEESVLNISIKSQEFDKAPIVIIRSTVVPETTLNLKEKFPNLKFAANPEFLREKSAVEDMRTTNRIVIGADPEVRERVKEIYRKIFPDAKYLLVDEKTAEMIKYASNSILASQTIIANEIHNICKILGVDYNTVKETLLLDDRIARNIHVPGHDGKHGFGGKCFPKDLNALIHLAKKKGYDPELLEQVWKSNLKFRK